MGDWHDNFWKKKPHTPEGVNEQIKVFPPVYLYIYISSKVKPDLSL